jgi:protein SCO1/2
MFFTTKYPKIWLILLLAVLPAIISACGAYRFNGGVLEPPLPLPDFELMSAAGQPFRLSSVQGDIALVYFGYTFCPDVCPLTLADVKKALAGLEGRERVHVIFVSVDPERDTPELLARYVKAFGPDFIGLTDDFTKTQAVMKAYGAFAERQEVPDSAAGYLMNHTARLYLVNSKRELQLTYPFGFKAEDLRADLTYLLQQEIGD